MLGSETCWFDVTRKDIYVSNLWFYTKYCNNKGFDVSSLLINKIWIVFWYEETIMVWTILSLIRVPIDIIFRYNTLCCHLCIISDTQLVHTPTISCDLLFAFKYSSPLWEYTIWWSPMLLATLATGFARQNVFCFRYRAANIWTHYISIYDLDYRRVNVITQGLWWFGLSMLSMKWIW